MRNRLPGTMPKARDHRVKKHEQAQSSSKVKINQKQAMLHICLGIFKGIFPMSFYRITQHVNRFSASKEQHCYEHEIMLLLGRCQKILDPKGQYII